MRLKEGVSLKGITPEVAAALLVADTIVPNLIVTAVTDGIHKRSSAHYTGRAFDFRLPPIDPSLLEAEIVAKLRLALGEPLPEPSGAAGVQWDVCLEKDHIHVEFDPKGPDATPEPGPPPLPS